MDAEVIDGVSILRLNRPPVNALDLDLVEDAVTTLRSVEGPVVITGTGRCFSAGVDLRAVVDGGREYTQRFLDAMPTAFLAVFDHPGPVVAAINGHAIAGGCVVAMAADVRLMSGGTIGLTEVAVGVPFPAAALEICRYAMGTSASNAMLGAQTVDATTALQRGWVDAVVPADELLSEAIATARALGAHSPFAYAATKDQLHRPTRTAIDAAAAIDPRVREGWMSDETFARISDYLAGLK
ncbi:enoyl-CoA hydratase/isomerase family protein [Mycobacterium sp. NPDC051804]|uniref:enoyl-CoA hydratase/isomerase family protein n=1 Tax=Mycobacterium sp. NPDC051804 TaxID=3364295 RepID=UPI003799B2D5